MNLVSVNCNLCGHDDWRVRFPTTRANGVAPDVSAFRCTSADYGQHVQIVQCRSCGYVYANPRWVEDSLLATYEVVEDEMYVQERYGRELTFRHHLEDMESYTGPADGRRLLDVGAYTGVFVEVALESGWDACGVEPSHWAVAEARRHGLPLVEGTLASLDLKKETFDVVTMWDVIEHFADPAAELAQAYDLLAPGGVIAVHTMNVESLAARLLGPRWPWLMDMHLHYFSPRTLAQMLQKVGFDVIWAGAQGRYLRLGYLVTRLRGINGALGRLAAAVVERFGLAEKPLPVNFGDLFTIYARRPHDTT